MYAHKFKFVLVNDMARAGPLSARSVIDRWNGATCTIFPLQSAIAESSATPNGWRRVDLLDRSLQLLHSNSLSLGRS